MAKGIIKTTWVAETSNYNKGCREAKKALESFGSGLGVNVKSLMSWQAGLASAAVALGAFAKSNIETAKNFEKSMSSLSSLTGMTGKDLDTLKKYAIELGGSTTQSASQVADAFKMIGSAKPELLSSGEALRDVTKAAITLGEAAGIDVTDAASALTTSLNQMGEGADAASRFVNVLAAASQKGAGDINWLREAITNSGTAAKAVGTSYEELVANLEQLAQGGFDASSAGTALRSIIMSLEKQSDNNFKPSIVGLTEAFKNLGDANLTISQYQEIVGKQFASQAMILAKNADNADRMTTAITGTKIAEEQASINTDNLEGAISRLSSAWEQFNLSLNSSNGILKKTVDWLAGVIGKVNELFNNDFVQQALKEKGYSSYKDEKTRGRQIGAYNTGKKAYDKQIAEKQKEYDEFVSVTNTYYKGSKIGKERERLAAQKKAELDAIKADRAKYIAEGQSYFYGKKGATTNNINTPPPSNPTVPKKTGSDDPVYAKGTISWYQQEISKLNKTLSASTDAEVRINCQKLIDDYKAAISEIEAEASQIGQRVRAYYKSSDYAGKNDRMLSDLQGSAFSTIDIKANDKDVTKLNIKPEELKKATDEATRLFLLGKQVGGSWQEAAQAVGGLGSALAGIEDPAAKVFGVIAEAIANVALSMAQALTKKESQMGGVWGWIAAAAAGTATMISTISAIKSATSYHAEGGIVGTSALARGTDTVPAMLTPGEIVLNRAQQGVLANRLQNSAFGQMRLSATIKGEDIRLALNNGSRRKGKGEYVTSK